MGGGVGGGGTGCVGGGTGGATRSVEDEELDTGGGTGGRVDEERTREKDREIGTEERRRSVDSMVEGEGRGQDFRER